MSDLAVVVVSTNERRWLGPCLSTVFEHAGDIDLDVVVADNMSEDGTREFVEAEFPGARVVTCPNRGFSHANNRGLMTTDARYVLFLNPDTEIVDGTFAELVAYMDGHADVGMVGVRQLDSAGEVYPTIRRFPNALRALGDALATERLPAHFGERLLDPDLYERVTPCDWTIGSFMLTRREAIESAGYLDERFFIYAEETDFCLRIRKAGWEIHHTPQMTIVHYAGKAGMRPKMVAQDAYARMQYGRKHFSPAHRWLYLLMIAARHLLRAAAAGEGTRSQRLQAARLVTRTLFGRHEPPFGEPPPVAVQRPAGRDGSASRAA